MKRIILLGFLISTLSAAEIIPESKITGVTVYSDRAVITRTVELDLPQGLSDVKFVDLPFNIMEQSLQASGKGDNNVSIVDVALKNIHKDKNSNERIKSLEHEISSLQYEKKLNEDKQTALKAQLVTLGKIEDSAVNTTVKDRIGMEDAGKLLAFMAEKRDAITKDQQALEKFMADLNIKIQVLQSTLNETRGFSNRNVKSIAVKVNTESTGKFTLNIKYTVPGASWFSSYDARLKSDTRKIDLTYYGVVKNQTGEDWKDVALILSTAKPSLGGGAPELPKWLVQPMQQRAEGGRVNYKNDAMIAEKSMAFNGLAVAPSAPMMDKRDASFVTTAMESNLTSATFKTSTIMSYPSDGSVQKVPITVAVLPANLQYQSTPKLRETAFLSAYTSNTTDFPFLAGPVNSFIDEAFIATSSIATIMSGEKLELSLGADEGIQVKRRLVNRFTEEAGITFSLNRVTYEIAITIINNKKTQERIVFKENIPVSSHEDVVVKLISPEEVGSAKSPKEVNREDDGRLVWRVNFKPGEKKEFILKFSVEHPKNMVVSGLN